MWHGFFKKKLQYCFASLNDFVLKNWKKRFEKEAVEGSRTLVSSLEGWGNKPLYDYRMD